MNARIKKILLLLILFQSFASATEICGTASFNGKTKKIPCASSYATPSSKICGTISINGKSKLIPCSLADKKTKSAEQDKIKAQTPEAPEEASVPEKSVEKLIAAKDVPVSFDCHATVQYEGKVFHLTSKYCKAPQQLAAAAVDIPGSSFLKRQKELSATINRIAAEYGLEKELVHALISTESAYRSNAVSQAGACGLMQLMPATAKHYGVTNSYNIEENLRGGMRYLSYLLKEFDNNKKLALAAYNAGEHNVRKYGNSIPPFVETQAYVPRVLAFYDKYRNEWKDQIQ